MHQDPIGHLDAQLDDGATYFLGMPADELAACIGYVAMFVEDAETREELELLVCALRGALERDVRGLAAQVAELEQRFGFGEAA